MPRAPLAGPVCQVEQGVALWGLRGEARDTDQSAWMIAGFPPSTGGQRRVAGFVTPFGPRVMATIS